MMPSLDAVPRTQKPTKPQITPRTVTRPPARPNRPILRAGAALAASPISLLTLAVVAGAAAGFAAGCSKGGSIAGLQDTGGIHLVVMSSDRNQSTGQYDVLLWDADSYQF